jgi:hypothetical protein
VLDHVLGDAANKQAAEPCPAVRPHNDEGRAQFIDGADDLDPRVALAEEGPPAACFRGELVEGSFACGEEIFVEARDHHGRDLGVRDHRGLADVEEDDLGAEGLGDLLGDLQGLDRRGLEIDGDDD